MDRRAIDQADDKQKKRRRRSVSVAEVAEFLEYLAPPSLAMPDGDSFGLQVGSPTSYVKSIVVSGMCTYSAVTAASARKHSLLVTAAPLITRPLLSIRSDEPVGNKLSTLMAHQSSLYALSNAIASAPGGLDDSLAQRLGIAATATIVPTEYEELYKVAVFTPVDHVDNVLMAASEAGAGRSGKYSHCSFQVLGEGTFLPTEGARPAIGTVGKLERLREIQIGMIVPHRELKGVIAAVLDAHPYEEVAYDVVPLKNPGIQYGRGRMGELPLSVSLETVLAQVQDSLPADSIRCSHKPDFMISSVAVASGMSKGLFWPANRGGAGVIVVGGVSLEDLMQADQSTTVIVDVGYSASVAPGLQRLCGQLRNTFGMDGVEVIFCP